MSKIEPRLLSPTEAADLRGKCMAQEKERLQGVLRNTILKVNEAVRHAAGLSRNRVEVRVPRAVQSLLAGELRTLGWSFTFRDAPRPRGAQSNEVVVTLKF